ncbi:MAG: YkgJ family cysteine cluster protein, partial [Proteobacteria bacterium]|nr:YkgJ family cysteine cluster protein [Pseudomonadota bacterium]
MDTTQSPRCRRCGDCCRNGGPALHSDDLDCFHGPDGLGMEHLITLRRGEMVRDQPTSSIVALDEEILKIRGKENSSICLFFQANPAGCSIYERRPAECRALSCSDPAPLKAMYKQDRLTRSDLLPEGHPLLELVDEHDHRCDPTELGRLCQQVLESQDQDVINVIGGML